MYFWEYRLLFSMPYCFDQNAKLVNLVYDMWGWWSWCSFKRSRLPNEQVNHHTKPNTLPAIIFETNFQFANLQVGWFLPRFCWARLGQISGSATYILHSTQCATKSSVLTHCNYKSHFQVDKQSISIGFSIPSKRAIYSRTVRQWHRLQMLLPIQSQKPLSQLVMKWLWKEFYCRGHSGCSLSLLFVLHHLDGHTYTCQVKAFSVTCW